jgi:HAE1 family hydrophobic/amphiphilic exporter-1/multidrug efflux pump
LLAALAIVVALAIATGAGSGARLVLGTAVVFGMSVATMIGIFIIPVFYVLVQGLQERLRGRPAVRPEAQS